ncbi:MAG: efflux RND transporter periplasmic adaptor subunit [Candidatus Omnitrophica bacterium]|nr:efflux RND transporter periplasmic adaptor subunit [Candidatus Omnitrophota bacterium]MBU4487813.1 efflux RND transporter periplasmic adaptor subunit [Candidatus Omnitrophota bacterium]MCG2705547.1 efflux RND transporter periplasmic adaptor subunit [Candidatus Omnitrophota bacterium]
MRKIIVLIMVLLFAASGCAKKTGQEQVAKEVPLRTETPQTTEAYYGCGVREEGHCPHCDEGKPDTQCICGGHSFIMKTDKPMNCPVCKKPLKKIEPQDTAKTTPLAKKTQKTVQRKILYYRNPMNPAITSEVPMKDSMGMDFIPVYEEADDQPVGGEVLSRVKLSPEQIELAGVKTEEIIKRHLSKLIRTVGKVAFDPELAVSQEEFLTALETREKVKNSSDQGVIKRADDLVEKSKFRLRLLGMGDDEIRALEEEGIAQMNLVLPEEKAWVYADIYEYELGWIKVGQGVLITTTAYPGERFDGVIKSISPVINPMTRSAKIRIEADNKDRKLQPEMYADVIIESMYVNTDGSHMTLAIPKDAVLDTGARKIVYVDIGGGAFIGKKVKLGPEASAEVDDQEQKFYPVLSGLKEGDKVVTKSNFLIDSQSQLSGGISGAYGGALTTEEEKTPPAPTLRK